MQEQAVFLNNSVFVWWFVSQEWVVSPRLPVDAEMSKSAAQTVNQLEAQSLDPAQRQSRTTAVGWELQQPAGNSLQLGMRF